MTVDYAAITDKQQKVWSLGDYGRVGSLLSWIGEALVHDLDIHAGERVLDVAAGNGNAALPAARRFADVLATDYVPELLEQAGVRARADGVALRTEVADAQALPYSDASFDVVMSTIGAMFAPDQEAVARELLRVCRPGGRIGMANWTPDSMIGDMFRAVGKRVPPPQGVQPASAWGSEHGSRTCFSPGAATSSWKVGPTRGVSPRPKPAWNTSGPGTGPLSRRSLRWATRAGTAWNRPGRGLRRSQHHRRRNLCRRSGLSAGARNPRLTFHGPWVDHPGAPRTPSQSLTPLRRSRA